MMCMQKCNSFLLNLRVGFFLATRQIRRSSKWTTSLIVFVMLLTFLNLVALYGVLVGLAQGVSGSYREHFTGDLIISALPTENYIKRSPEVLALLRSFPQVEAVSPRYVLTGLVEANYKNKVDQFSKPNMAAVKFVGIDPEEEDAFSDVSKNVVEGAYLSRDDYDQILIGSQFVEKYTFGMLPGIVVLRNIEPGTKVRITVAGVTREVTVKGIVKSKVIELASRVYMPAQEFRTLIGRNDFNVSEISIRLKPGEDPAAFHQLLIASGVDNMGKIQTASEALPGTVSDISQTLSTLGNGFGSIGLVVASVTIFIVIFINAITRRKFIGILKGIGIRSAVIETSYVMQSVFYAVCGSVLGLLLLYGILVPYVAAHPIDFPTADGILYAPIGGTLLRVASLMVATIIAGYIPARMIVKKNTLDSILGRN